ncbi:DUF2000 domain-containing protein [Streptomyces sp. TRM68367]|uniref:DUF2000 domain-containing protein n=1 Tax=Streptomyces sp. TRM68367 TaxID=2758415 RepID=UPI00165CB6FC|nr:DUF2000 domain-containing protein [Streptomyces sp. TRM68367]MBC9726532.1 DUF2000 domain-containing protein [Streptomyces sp. TRM68367]
MLEVGEVVVASEQVDAEYKFVVALKAKLDRGVAANAASHLCLGLVAKAAAERPELVQRMSFLQFPDASGNDHSPVSGLSLIALEGRPAWLRKLRGEALDSGLLCTDFTAQMTGGSYLDQLDRMKQTPESDLDYYGVAVFGTRADVDPLTKKFSLLR